MSHASELGKKKVMGRVLSQPQLTTELMTKSKIDLETEISKKGRMKTTRAKNPSSHQFQTMRSQEKQILGVEEKASAQMNKYL